MIDRRGTKGLHGYETVRRMMSQPHRYYHNMDHVNDLLEKIRSPVNGLTDEQMYILEVVAMLHDIVYDPRFSDNEELSAKFVDVIYDKNWTWFDKYRQTIKNIIIRTHPENYENKLDIKNNEEDFLYKTFVEFDTWAFHNGNSVLLFNNFKKILKEFQYLSYPEFKKGALEFLEYMVSLNKFSNKVLFHYKAQIQLYRPRIGIYAGSFNPFHVGHMSVLEQADKVFDKVIVAQPLLTERNTSYGTEIVLPYHEVVEFEGLLVDFIKPIQEYADVTLVRGLRNGDDLEYEVNMKKINEDLAGHICDTIYFVTDMPHVSSTVVRSLPSDIQSKYIPIKYDYAYEDY